MADLLTAAAYFALRKCGGPAIDVRAGRVDAQEAGTFGAPDPTETFHVHRMKFERANRTQSQMIQMIACGHCKFYPSPAPSSAHCFITFKLSVVSMETTSPSSPPTLLRISQHTSTPPSTYTTTTSLSTSSPQIRATHWWPALISLIPISASSLPTVTRPSPPCPPQKDSRRPAGKRSL